MDFRCFDFGKRTEIMVFGNENERNFQCFGFGKRETEGNAGRLDDGIEMNRYTLGSFRYWISVPVLQDSEMENVPVFQERKFIRLYLE
ncbi:unnamed protein product [Rhizophagus irregularis]|nr:unnamed protein product [Rhizophagus irregularis]